MSDSIPPRPDGPHPAPVPPMPTPPQRQRATWRWWEAIGVYVVVMLVSSFVTLPVLLLIHSKGLADLAGSAVVAVVTVALLVAWLSRYHRAWRAVVGFPARVWPEVRAGAAFGALLYPAIVFGVGFVVNLLFSMLSGHQVRAPQQIPSHLSAVGTTVATAYAVVIAPIHEELFFRGILFRSLRDRHGFRIGMVGSGLAFGLIHYIPGPALDSLLLMSVMVFTGMALAYLYERRGNIVANMVAHATFNVIGLVLIFAIR